MQSFIYLVFFIYALPQLCSHTHSDDMWPLKKMCDHDNVMEILEIYQNARLKCKIL